MADDEENGFGDSVCWLSATCARCGALVEDATCWNCGAPRMGKDEDPAGERAAADLVSRERAGAQARVADAAP